MMQYRLEAKLEEKVCKYARSRGWLCYKWMSPSQNGVPDRIFFKDGVCQMIEFKAPRKQPTALQYAIHRQLKDHGFHVYVVSDFEQGKILF